MGRLPTNNRAELEGVVTALKILRTLNNPLALIFSDSKYVVDGVNHHSLPSSHLDLWAQIDKLWHSSLEIGWVKGHQSLVGNIFADFLAGEAVKLNLPPPIKSPGPHVSCRPPAYSTTSGTLASKPFHSLPTASATVSDLSIHTPLVLFHTRVSSNSVYISSCYKYINRPFPTKRPRSPSSSSPLHPPGKRGPFLERFDSSTPKLQYNCRPPATLGAHQDTSTRISQRSPHTDLVHSLPPPNPTPTIVTHIQEPKPPTVQENKYIEMILNAF